LILDRVSYFILTFPVWPIYVWMGFMAALSVIVLLSGQYTNELYIGTMINIGAPVGAYIGLWWYKKKYNFI